MPEAPIVEDQEPEEVEPDLEVEQEELDPVAKLTEVQEQKRKLAEVEMDVLTKKEAIEQEEQALHHALAVGLVAGLFTELQGFASEFTSGVIYERYQGIQAHIDKIRQHDGVFPRSLAESRYEVDSEHFQFWLGVLEKFISTGEPLEKFLGAVFPKTHGTPFERP